MTENVVFDPSRRRFPRVHLKAFAQVVSVSKHDIGKEFNAECVNISEGGCCIELDTLLSGPDIDYGIKVGIELPDGEDRLITNGKITWLKEENKELITKYLVGVQFNHLKPEEKERIRKYVHSMLEARH